MEMLLTGDDMSVQDAARWGLINKVVPKGEALNEARNSPNASRCQRAARGAGGEASWRSAAATSILRQGCMETLVNRLLRETEDAKEGPRAFAEKRKPDFKGSGNDI